MQTIGVGIIGWGFMGKTHTHAIRCIPLFYPGIDFEAKLVGVCSRTVSKAEAAKEQFGFEFATGDYRELLLTNRQYAFSRTHSGNTVLITVNNDGSDYVMTLPCGNDTQYKGLLSGELVSVTNGQITVNVHANSGDIWVPFTQAPCNDDTEDWFFDSAFITNPEPAQETVDTPLTDVCEQVAPAFSSEESFEQGKIAGLQEAILAIMEKKGPVTEQMRKDVFNNTHHDSLVNWVKSFY